MKHFDSHIALLPELLELSEVIHLLGDHVNVIKLTDVRHHDVSLPVLALEIGASTQDAPVLGLFGGVHGLERIGTQVVLAYLRSLGAQLRWDRHLRDLLSQVRLICIPIVNPLGMLLKTRANANGIDLMRNAPLDSATIPGYHLHAGHRISPRLPWYRGRRGENMEAEAAALCRFVTEHIRTAPVAVTIDVHSGYGVRDRLWFPFASSRERFPDRAEIVCLRNLFNAAYPHNIYTVEPQCLQYLTHGDLWDYLYYRHQANANHGIFLPYALELGSWLWMKKSLRQYFSLLGVFNPIARHRLQRTLRRHLFLFDFYLRAINSSTAWIPVDPAERISNEQQAEVLWYSQL